MSLTNNQIGNGLIILGILFAFSAIANPQLMSTIGIGVAGVNVEATGIPAFSATAGVLGLGLIGLGIYLRKK